MPGCRLYLIAPSHISDPAAFAPLLDEAIAASDVASLLLRLDDASETVLRAAVEIFRPVCHARDVALLLSTTPALAVSLECDGVHLDDPGTYSGARDVLGSNRIVGVGCGLSTHAAMEVAEADADYVAFGNLDAAPDLNALTELVAGWTTFTTVPCVAGGRIDAAEAEALVRAGVEFLAIGPTVWDAPEGPAAAVRRFAALIQSAQGRAPA